MKSAEKFILITAILAIFVTVGLFLLRSAIVLLSPDILVWSGFGDYFGGVLSPILSFILIVLIIKEAVESRRNYHDSRMLQQVSQEQIDKQIEILKPRPEIVYYIFARGSKIFAVLENSGNSTAYNIRTRFKFDPQTKEESKVMFNKIEQIEYFPVKLKFSFLIGILLENGKIIGIGPHSVTITYSDQIKNGNIYNRQYSVGVNMLESLHREPDYGQALEDLASELKKLKQKI